MERVVVTGASSGIGAATVEMFRGHGIEVLGVDVSASSDADEHFAIDLSRSDCGERVLEFCAGRPIDGLVNNAARSLDKLAVDTSSEDFDEILNVNLRAPFLVASSLQPVLASRKGFVVNVASVHAVATSIGVSVYATSKGGLVSMTRALALEWAPDVRVTAILPGAVDTEMLRSGLDRTSSSLQEYSGRQPMGRVGAAGEIADAVWFLANSEFSTGSTLIVDGGATARLSSE